MVNGRCKRWVVPSPCTIRSGITSWVPPPRDGGAVTNWSSRFESTRMRRRQLGLCLPPLVVVQEAGCPPPLPPQRDGNWSSRFESRRMRRRQLGGFGQRSIGSIKKTPPLFSLPARTAWSSKDCKLCQNLIT